MDFDLHVLTWGLCGFVDALWMLMDVDGCHWMLMDVDGIGHGIANAFFLQPTWK